MPHFRLQGFSVVNRTKSGLGIGLRNGRIQESNAKIKGDKILIWTIYILIFALGLVGGSSFVYSGWSILADKNCDSVAWGVEYNQYFSYQCFPNDSGEMGQATAGLLALIGGALFLFFSGYPLYRQIQDNKKNGQD